MPNEYIDISDLIENATEYLYEQNSYGKKNGKNIESTWKQFLKFCNDNGYYKYSSSVKDKFILHFTNWVPSLKPDYIRIKSSHMQMLDLFAHNGKWTKGHLYPKPELTGNFSSFINELDNFLEKHDYSQNSRITLRKKACLMLHYFQNVGLEEMNQIDRNHLTKYVMSLKGHARSTLRCELSSMRRILRYAYVMEFTKDDLSKFIPKYNLGQPQSNIKIWESEEIKKVLDTVDRSNPKGLRDAAIITIASELAMRSKEILDLKFSDIDWESCSISFVQCKTRKPNTLPLNEKTGTAIIEYLRVRPKTDCEYVFVSMNPPYDKMKRFNSSFQKYVTRAGISIPYKAHHGLHSLRATVATRLLEADVSPDDIVSFVGHSDRESLNNYIRMDIEHLRECALSFEDGEFV